MSTSASALAQVLANHSDEDVLQALQLLDSLRPEFREHLAVLTGKERLKRYSGVIASFLPEKGYGFISSEEATANFGKDVFCSANEVGDFKKGQEVSFTVIVNRTNQPQARLLQDAAGTVPMFVECSVREEPAKRASQSNYEEPAKRQRPAIAPSSKEIYSAPVRVAPQQPQVVAPQVVAPVPPWKANGNRFVGTIANFTGVFGFISSPRATAEFHKDVFLSSNELAGFAVGDVVSFDIALNKNGQPQARNLQRSSADRLSAPSAEDWKGGKAGRKSGGPVNGGWDTRAVPVKKAPGSTSKVEPESSRFEGVISTFNPGSHFGFISSKTARTMYGKDVFLSDQEVGSYEVGDAVSFRVVLNSRGHPQARDLAPAGADFDASKSEGPVEEVSW